MNQFAKTAAEALTNPVEMRRLGKLAQAMAYAAPNKEEEDEGMLSKLSPWLWTVGGLGTLAGGGYLAHKSGLLDYAGSLIAGGDDSGKSPGAVQRTSEIVGGIPGSAVLGASAINAARGSNWATRNLPVGTNTRGLRGMAREISRLNQDGKGADAVARSNLRSGLTGLNRDDPARLLQLSRGIRSVGDKDSVLGQAVRRHAADTVSEGWRGSGMGIPGLNSQAQQLKQFSGYLKEIAQPNAPDISEADAAIRDAQVMEAAEKLGINTRDPVAARNQLRQLSRAADRFATENVEGNFMDVESGGRRKFYRRAGLPLGAWVGAKGLGLAARTFGW